MTKTKLIVKTSSKTYPIYFGNNIINKTGRLIKKKTSRCKKSLHYKRFQVAQAIAKKAYQFSQRV